jgi:hypothetical protein
MKWQAVHLGSEYKSLLLLMVLPLLDEQSQRTHIATFIRIAQRHRSALSEAERCSTYAHRRSEYDCKSS